MPRSSAVLALAAAASLMFDVDIARALLIADRVIVSGDVPPSWHEQIDAFQSALVAV